MFWKRKQTEAMNQALMELDEPLLLMRYANFVPMYGTYFNSFIRIFMLHGIMSTVLLGIVAAINSGDPQEPVFYVSVTLFYGVISVLIIGMTLRLRNLISLYRQEIETIETRIRLTTQKRRTGLLTSQYITYLIFLVSVIISCYLISPARDEYMLLKPFSGFLKLFDVPIDLSGLEI